MPVCPVSLAPRRVRQQRPVVFPIMVPDWYRIEAKPSLTTKQARTSLDFTKCSSASLDQPLPAIPMARAPHTFGLLASTVRACHAAA
jgi:hypothetical protein